MLGIIEITDREAVISAIAEFDDIGQEAFLHKYGFNRSRSYLLEFNGSRYDSKAILAAAYGYQFPHRGPLTSDELSGGWATTRKRLVDLGFVVEVRDPLDKPPVHLLLKWDPVDDPDTIAKHLAAAEAHDGLVWWGNFTQGQRRASMARVQLIREQIANGRPTYAYLYRIGKRPGAHRAEIKAITIQRSEVNEDLVPSYYSPDQQHSIYVLLSDIEPYDLEWVQTHLVQATNPVPGSLALKTQTSPLYAVELDSAGDPMEYEELEDAMTPELEAPPEPAPLTPEWLREQTLWSEDQIAELLSALEGSSPQVLLAGPPGTGKSWVAQAFARYLTADRTDRWKLVQFHPSYGYESFIEGLRPVLGANGIEFDRVDGAVLRLAGQARGTTAPHVMVIDELNRANIPRVLGELMFLFEYRDHKIDLQYSTDFALPENLSFIATMNTADRSIRSIDVALRRRFEIYECLPDATILERFYGSARGVNQVPDLLIGFEALNAALTDELDRHHTIGHTFFIASVMSTERLKRVWDRKIQPLIEEYFFDQPDLAADFTIARFWASAAT